LAERLPYHRDIVDADLIALVASGNPSMLVDPYGALVKDLCPDRMRQSRCGPSAGDSLLLASAACMRVLLRQENHEGATRSRAIVSRRCVIESELKDQPESEELGSEAWSTLHGDIAVNFERIDNRYLETTGGVYANQTRLVLPSHLKHRPARLFQKLLRLK